MEKKTSRKFKPNELCVTCIHQKDCVFAGKGKKPVMQCEEFDFMNKDIHINSENILQNENLEAVYVQQFKGLCATCENRDSCVLKKSEAGVWHCEEYC